MVKNASFSAAASEFQRYCELAKGLGLEVNAAAFRKVVLNGDLRSAQAQALFGSTRNRQGNGAHGSVPASLVRHLRELNVDLARCVVRGLNGQRPKGRVRQRAFLHKLAHRTGSLCIAFDSFQFARGKIG